MANEYEAGTDVRCEMYFYSDREETTLADPTTITFRLTSPGGVHTDYSYPADAQVVRDTTGTYHVNAKPLTLSSATTVAGKWTYTYRGTGTVGVTKEKWFTVTRTKMEE